MRAEDTLCMFFSSLVCCSYLRCVYLGRKWLNTEWCLCGKIANKLIIGKHSYGSRARRHGLRPERRKDQLSWVMFPILALSSLCSFLEEKLRELFKVVAAEFGLRFLWSASWLNDFSVVRNLVVKAMPFWDSTHVLISALVNRVCNESMILVS